MKKKYSIVLIITLAMILICNNAYATGLSASSIMTKAKTFANGGNTVIDQTSMEGLSTGISGILLGIGTIVIFLVGTLLGIKYMTGSAEGKAKVMDSLIPSAIGVIVIYGSYAIWKIAVQFIDKIQ